jgi:hypothetical protein
MAIDPPLQPRRARVEDLLDTPDEAAQTICELGTVGWFGDDEVAEMGAADNSGANYIKVTLQAGAPPGEPSTADGYANGHQVLARLLEPARYIPSFGKPCIVLFPGGKVESQGAGLCLPIGGPSQLKLPNEKPGEVCMHGEAGQFIRMKADGEISLYTTVDGTTTGQSMYVRLSPKDGFEVSTPWCRFRAGPEGGHWEHSGGAAIRMGAVGGMPPPLDALGSYVSMSAAMAQVEAAAVSLGTDAGGASFAAKVALASALTAVSTALNAISITPAAVGSPVLTPGQAAAATAAISAATAIVDDIGKVA